MIFLFGSYGCIVSVQLQTIKDNSFFIEAYLKPKEINICSNCNSTNVISNCKKQRCFQDEYYSNEPTFISLTYHRFLCKNCSKMFVDKMAGLNPKHPLLTNIKLNILEDLKDDISSTAVASKRHLSTSLWKEPQKGGPNKNNTSCC